MPPLVWVIWESNDAFQPDADVHCVASDLARRTFIGFPEVPEAVGVSACVYVPPAIQIVSLAETLPHEIPENPDHAFVQLVPAPVP